MRARQSLRTLEELRAIHSQLEKQLEAEGKMFQQAQIKHAEVLANYEAVGRTIGLLNVEEPTEESVEVYAEEPKR